MQFGYAERAYDICTQVCKKHGTIKDHAQNYHSTRLAENVAGANAMEDLQKHLCGINGKT